MLSASGANSARVAMPTRIRASFVIGALHSLDHLEAVGEVSERLDVAAAD
jgi:hypothetical protein